MIISEEYFWREVPFVYRNHEAPDEEKIKSLSTFINNFGFHIHVGNQEVKPKEVQKLLAKIEDTPQEAMICRLALRSMKRAGYTPENLGHFGLAAKYYTHYFSDSSVSGSSDPPDHQRCPARTDEGRKSCAL